MQIIDHPSFESHDLAMLRLAAGCSMYFVTDPQAMLGCMLSEHNWRSVSSNRMNMSLDARSNQLWELNRGNL